MASNSSSLVFKTISFLKWSYKNYDAWFEFWFIIWKTIHLLKIIISVALSKLIIIIAQTAIRSTWILRSIICSTFISINFNFIELTNTNYASVYIELPLNNSEGGFFYAYTNSSVTPNVFTTYSSSIYNRSADLSNYVYEDITEWIWPRLIGSTSNCQAQLPVFQLNNSYK